MTQKHLKNTENAQKAMAAALQKQVESSQKQAHLQTIAQALKITGELVLQHQQTMGLLGSDEYTRLVRQKEALAAQILNSIDVVVETVK